MILNNIHNMYSIILLYMISCMYLIKLQENLYKYGRTRNFKHRSYEHKLEYNDLSKNIEIIHLEIIDKKYLSKAERDVARILKGYQYKHKNKKELIQVPHNYINGIITMFKDVGTRYKNK